VAAHTSMNDLFAVRIERRNEYRYERCIRTGYLARVKCVSIRVSFAVMSEKYSTT